MIKKITLKKTFGYQTIQLPVKVSALHIGMQRNNLCMWFTDLEEGKVENTELYIEGTGQLDREYMYFTYLQTVVDDMDEEVYHIFLVED